MAYVTVISQGTRQAGSYTTPAETIPAGTTRVSLRALMDAADIVDPTKSVSCNLDVSDTGGATWRPDPLAGMTWVGSPENVGRLGNPPDINLTFDPPLTAPLTLRARVVIGSRMKIGVEQEIV